MKKVILINPPYRRILHNLSGVYPLPPLGLAYIAAVLEKNHFDVEIIDMPALNMSVESLKAYLKGDRGFLYGISCKIINLNHGIKIARIIKDINPGARVILGGRCNVFPPEQILKYGKDFDVLVRGEGEEVTLELFNNLRDNGEFKNLGKVRGISYRDGNRVVTTGTRPYLDLNNLPLPSRHLLPNKNYRMHPPFNLYPPVTLVETSRGCEYNCIFCTLPEPFRQRTVNNVMEELRELVSKFKIKEIHFVDPNFTFDKEQTIKLCDCILKDDLNIKWTCKTRVDLVSEDLLKLMVRAGCYMISYGIESGSQEILNSLNKNITVTQIEDAFNLTRKHKIRTLGYVIVGSPGENDNSIKETYKLVKRIKPDFVLYGEFLPDPKSAFANQLINAASLRHDDLFEFYALDVNIFRDRTVAGINSKDVNKWLSFLNRSFYFNLFYIMQRLKNIRNMNDLLNQIKGAYFILKDKLSAGAVFKK